MTEKHILWIDRPIILASKSPRRHLLLKEVGIDFEVVTKEVVEDYPEGLAVHEIPVHIARKKATAVKSILKSNEIILTADTIVALGDTIFGKPKDEADAHYILSQLSGKAHDVITGVCLTDRERESTFFVNTKVFFKTLTNDEIFYYIKNYQPYDKAGAYAIQEWLGMVGVEKMEGCYFNVVGLPVNRVLEELKRFTIED